MRKTSGQRSRSIALHARERGNSTSRPSDRKYDRLTRTLSCEIQSGLYVRLDSNLTTLLYLILCRSLRYFGEVQTETSLYIRLDPHRRHLLMSAPFISRQPTLTAETKSC